MIRIALVEDEREEREKIKECLNYLEESEGFSIKYHDLKYGIASAGAVWRKARYRR